MLKIRVTSPFRYQYYNGDDKLIKDHYLAAGDYYHLDSIKDKNEIKFMLSPNFTFKNYIHVDTESISENIVKELELETGLYTDDLQLPKEEEYIPTVIQNNKFIDTLNNYFQDDLTNDPEPVKEPEINIFDQTSKESEKVEDNTDSKVEEVLIETEDLEKKKRRTELEDFHYSKVKDLAERYDLEYTSKKEVIEEILKLEY